MTAIPVWSIILPPLATAAVCSTVRSTTLIRWISILGSVVGLGVAGFLARSALSLGPLGTGGLRLDALGAYLALIISVLALAASLASGEFMEYEAESEKLGINSWRVYYGLLHLFVTFMLLVPIANNLGVLWVAVEATTLSSAFLVGFHRHHHAMEAAWKYVILCSVGIAFAFFGTILLYYAGARAGGGGSLDWTAFMETAPRMDPKIVKLAFLFAALGYGTKAGLAPMHTWLPDAHSQAPSPVSAMLSGVLLTSAFYALVRFYSIAAPCLGPVFLSRAFLLFGLCSLAIAAPFILIARDYKRMLAYSSVEHMGFLALGLGIGTPTALYGTFLHLLCHALAKALAFLSAGRILHAFGTRKITKVAGALAVTPETGGVFLAAVLALSGLPPFGIFTSEIIVLSQGFASGRIMASIGAVALLVTACGGGLYHAVQMSFGRPRRALHSALTPNPRIAWEWAAPAALLLSPLVALGCWIPRPLDAWLSQMARIVLGGGHG